ncbi:MAG: multicopper oxidase family protein [Solirubrobacteraceae bacterium]
MRSRNALLAGITTAAVMAAVVTSLVITSGGGGQALARGAAGSQFASQDQGRGRYGTEYENTGTGPMVRPTIPTTPSVPTDFGQFQCSSRRVSSAARRASPRLPAPRGCTRVFQLTASQFEQRFANFPVQRWMVWGYNGSTPGPTLISYAGERVQIVVRNQLPVPTTLHPHGLHQSNSQDGVAGIDETPIAPGASHTYTITPGHVGSFAYHSHTETAVEDLRGLDGMWVVLPRWEHRSVHVQKDVVMTLQQWAPQPIVNGMPDGTKVANDVLTVPFPGGTGDFPFSTIDGKTGEASGSPITIHRGDMVRIRLYNASNLNHSMHLHGHDEVLVSKNGHAVPPVRETTQDVAPGDFFEIEFKADNPGNWIFHCHVPHHTSNAKESGYEGGPVGMTRVFHYAGYKPVPPGYFAYAGQNSTPAP